VTRNQKWLLGIFLAFFVLAAGIIFTALAVAIFGPSDFKLAGSFGERVGIVEINGVINESQSVLRQIKTFREDESIRALVLRVNSPGGAVAPSQEIYAGLLKFKETTEKPVVASMGSVAASGGYYITCAADSILASPGSLTGSIGVLLEFPDLHEVLKKVGIGFEVIKSAEHKDIGSPFRRITEKEREILQEMVDDVFDQFVEVVSSGRALSRDSVLAFADGRIFSGRQAYNFGLIDRTGGFQDAIDTAGRMCGLGENPKTVRVRKRRPSWLELINDTATRLQDPASAMSSPRLLYLFR
jgi:protease-4